MLVGFTVPFLAISAVKAFTFKGGFKGFRAWNWVAITFVCYIASLWINATVKSFSVIEEFALILNGLGALGVIFAVISAAFLVKQNFGSAFKCVGLTLATVGLYYLLYAAYTFVVDKQSFSMLAEIWTIPLLGLGLSLMRIKSIKWKT